MQSISVADLAQQLEQGVPMRLLDVRRAQVLKDSGMQIAGAQWKNPALWLDWKDDIAHDLPVVVYCAHGHEISQGLTATLLAMGANARNLQGGFSAWLSQGHAVVPVAAQAQTS